MDPFEEFEFKPLTEGLGFHKKAEKPAAESFKATESFKTTKSIAKEEAAHPERERSQSISDLIAALPPSLDFLLGEPEETPAPRAATEPESEARPQIFQPVGRKEYSKTTEAGPLAAKATTQATTSSTPTSSNRVAPATSSPVSNIAPMPTLKSPLGAPATNDITRSFPHLEKSKQQTKAPKAAVEAPKAKATENKLRKVSASFSAAILDGMIAAGFSTIFLVIILLITKIDLVAMLSHASTDMQTHIHLGLLFLSVLTIYMLSARGMFGATLGEWAFDLQIGTKEEQRRPAYLAKIIWRMVLVMITGFITLPLLSKIFRRDLFAMLGAPQLYSRILR